MFWKAMAREAISATMIGAAIIFVWCGVVYLGA